LAIHGGGQGQRVAQELQHRLRSRLPVMHRSLAIGAVR
jgi:hypothetical protein